MAIGTLAAIGLGLAGVGSAVGAISSSNAAGKAVDASQATAQQNNALARDIYGQNKEALNPFVQRGNKAGNAINALLGLGGPEQPAANDNVFAQFAGGNYGRNRGYDGREPTFAAPYNSINGAQFGFNGYPGLQFGQQQQTVQQPAQGQGSAQEAQENAFDVFRNSTGYQFRVNEGADALNSNFAGSGVLRSGAAAKAMEKYRQGQASNEFGNYIGYLSNQQGTGLSGASALAGVGQNYANSVSANNNNAGNAAANAALIRGQNNPFASALGTIGGFASSYG